MGISIAARPYGWVYVTIYSCLNGNFDCRQTFKLGHESPMTPLPGTHLGFSHSQGIARIDFDTLATHHAWLCAGTSSQAGEVNLAMIPQTALATKLRRAENQPLACVLTLHGTSDIWKVLHFSNWNV